MKRTLRQLAIFAGLAIPSSLAWGAPCDAVTACELPASNGTQGSWTPSASRMTAIQSNNSIGPTGNVSTAKYFFAASTTDQGATLAKGTLTTTGDGAEVIGSFTFPSGSTPSSTVFGGVVQNLLGNQSYTFYAQACPNSAALDSGLCSSWARVGTRSTLAYPTAVFSAPVAPNDATISSLTGRVAVPTDDTGSISLVRLEIRDLINAANNQTLAPIGFPGNGTFPINNTMYTQNGGFKPNVKYEYRGRVVYPYGVDVPTAGAETEGPFWTTPADPFNVTRTNITHCSVEITARNSSGVPANPTYTPYRLCANSTCATDAGIGGTGIPTDTITRTVVGLSPGTSYTPNARAIAGNGSDASANSWNPSAQVSGSGFTTLDWGGSSSVSAITATSANYNLTGLDTTGVVSYQIFLNGSGQGSVAGVPPATIPLSGLTPNTQYTVGIQLSEAACPSGTILVQNFTTNPNTPQTFDLNTPQPTSLVATWATNGNPGGTIFQVEYCLGTALPGTGCATRNSAAGATTVTLTGLTPNTNYVAHVRALTVGGGANSAYSNEDTAATLPDVRSITITPSTAAVLTSGGQLFAAIVKNDLGVTIPGQAVSWAITSGGGSLTSSNGVSTTYNAPTTAGAATLTASLSGWPDATASITITASGISFISGPTFTVNPNQLTGSASVDATYNGVPDPTLTYTWSVQSGPTTNLTVSPNGTTGSKTPALTFTKAGTYVLKVTVAHGSDNNSANTASGVVAQVLTSLRVSPDNITIKKGQVQDFAATGADQFGDGMTLSNVSWSSNVSASGANASFTAASIGTSIQVTATSGGKNGFATVNVLDFDVSNAKAYPVPFKSTQHTKITFGGLGSSAKVRIYTITGKNVFEVDTTAGTYDWDVKNSAGEKLASGVYFYHIESPDAKKDGKIVIIQ